MNEDKLIDKFGAIIDEFLKENEIIMQVTMPEKSDVPEVVDNTGGGAVMQFYIITKTLPILLNELTKQVGELEVEPMLDDIFEILKSEVLDMKGKE